MGDDNKHKQEKHEKEEHGEKGGQAQRQKDDARQDNPDMDIPGFNTDTDDTAM